MQSSWSPNGETVVFAEDRPETKRDIWSMSLNDGRIIAPVVGTRYDESNPVMRPDGRWLAFQTDESGRLEVYIQQFPHAQGKQQVSVQGGRWPRWRPDGNELFFVSLTGSLMVVDVESVPELTMSTPKALPISNIIDFDVASDGRVLAVERMESARKEHRVVLVQNWFEELERLVPTSN